MARPIYVRFETPSDLADKALQLVQVASETGKIRGWHERSDEIE